MATATLGIDVGLSGARAAVMTLDGELLGAARVLYNRPQAADAASAADPAEGDPLAWQAAAERAACAALAEAPDCTIAAIGVGALGPCPVLLDEDLRPLGPSPLFALDPRAEAFRHLLAATQGLPDAQLGPDHALPKLFWLRHETPARLARATQVCDATGFLVAQLTGQAVMDPVTLCDYQAGGLASPVPLARVVPGDSVAGGLTAAAAARLGLPAGTPVAAGSYDSYVDVAGTGARTAGEGCVLLGSTLILGCVAGIAAAPEGLRATPHLGPGWFVGGWTSTAGSLLRWSRATNGEAAASAAASLPPGAGGLLMLPYFAGERAPHWDSQARGAVVGLSLATTPAELHRAAIDAVALSARDLTERLAGGGLKPARLRATGGGARDPAWRQAVADATGCELAVMAHAGQAVGPAALAWRALGRQPAANVDFVVTPEPRRQARYRALHGFYRDLYPALAGTLHGLGRLAREVEII